MLRAHREGRCEETSVLTTGSITDTEYISRSQIIVFLSLLAHQQFQTLHSCIQPSPAWGHRRLFDLSACIVEVGSCFNWVSCFSKAGIHPQYLNVSNAEPCEIVFLYSINGFYNCNVIVVLLRSGLSRASPSWSPEYQLRSPPLFYIGFMLMNMSNCDKNKVVRREFGPEQGKVQVV